MTPNRFVLAGLPLALAACVPWSGRPSPLSPEQEAARTAPLASVVAQVTSALDQYQESVAAGGDSLPAISAAEFEFKVTTATTGTGTVNFLIFKFGASRENDVVDDVTFIYSPPQPRVTTSGVRQPPLTDALAIAIRSAEVAVKSAPRMNKLELNKIALVIQYSLKWDGNASATGPFSIVTAGLSGDRNKTAVQSVKLTFGK